MNVSLDLDGELREAHCNAPSDMAAEPWSGSMEGATVHSDLDSHRRSLDSYDWDSLESYDISFGEAEDYDFSSFDGLDSYDNQVGLDSYRLDVKSGDCDMSVMMIDGTQESLAKAFTKPQRFDGTDSKWIEWCFQVKAYLIMHEIFTEGVLDRIGKTKNAISTDEVPADKEKPNVFLYYLLASL